MASRFSVPNGRIAIGVPITAAALFETIFVKMAIMSINPLNTRVGDMPIVKNRNSCAR